MTLLNRFWHAIERVPGLSASGWEWRSHLGPDFNLASRFLRPTGDRADCLPIGSGEPHRVVVHSVGNMVAVAPDTNETTEVGDDDVAVLALNARSLRKALATALALRASTTAIDRTTGFRVGTWEPQPSTAFPVFFAAGHDAGSYDRAIRALVDEPIAPGLVLVPTLDLCSDTLVDMARGRSILLAPLTGMVGVDGGHLVVTDAWAAHLGAFCQLAGVTFPSSFSNKRPKRKRATRTASIEALKKELIEEIRSRRGLLRHAEDRGIQIELPARPTRKALGGRAGIPPSTVSRCFSDANARDLCRLYDMLECPEDLIRFGR